MAARAAGALLLVVGLANVAVGAVGLLTDQRDLSAWVAAALLLAGLATVVLARWVWRGHRRAVVLGLVVFELLLVPRLLGLGEVTGAEIVSVVALLAVVVALGIATYALRRRDREEAPRDRAARRR